MPIGSILTGFSGSDFPSDWVIWHCTECLYSVTFDDLSYFYAASDDIWISAVADLIWHEHTENVFDNNPVTETPSTYREALVHEMASVDRNISAQESLLEELRTYRAEIARQITESAS